MANRPWPRTEPARAKWLISLVLNTLLGASLVFVPGLLLGSEITACAGTVHDVRLLVGDPAFSRQWSETSMDDGKPLIVSLGERNGRLRLEFVKTGEGLWAELSGCICRAGDVLELKVTKEQIHLGPAAHWGLGMALANGGIFTFRRTEPDRLLIATRGWKGSFVSLLAD